MSIRLAVCSISRVRVRVRVRVRTVAIADLGYSGPEPYLCCCYFNLKADAIHGSGPQLMKNSCR